MGQWLSFHPMQYVQHKALVYFFDVTQEMYVSKYATNARKYAIIALLDHATTSQQV